MTFANMASVPFVFIILTSCICIKCEVNTVNVPNNVETYKSEVSAVLNYLNSLPVKLYNYKQATLLNAHQKADITELTLDIDVDCINKYPELPCTEKVLICNAFVGKGPGGEPQVLSDVKCKPKPEIIVEEPPYASTVATEAESNETKQIALSNEAVSSEVGGGDHFVAIRRNSVPCLGCPFDLNPNAEGVDELVDLALGHLETERSHKQALVRVLKVQQQVVAGVKYILLVEVGPTVCPKETPWGPESCPLDTSAETSLCRITYLHKPWINKAKHIISNNCTVSQEFTKSDLKKDTRDNEIDVSMDRSKPEPNFDKIAESGAADLMTPSRLADLESQIIVEPELQNQPTRFRIIDDFIVPSTAQSEIVSLEDRPTIHNTEEAFAQMPTEEASSTPSADEQRVVDDFVAAYYGSVDSADFPQHLVNESETTEIPNREVNVQESHDKQAAHLGNESEAENHEDGAHENRQKRAIRESIIQESLEKQGKHLENQPYEDGAHENRQKRAIRESIIQESLEKQGKDLENQPYEDGAHENRKKRTVRQLEKISPDEKPLVKNLADFAASALDNIDDDNHKRVILQILGAKKMVGDEGIYYHLIMRMGISKCLEDKAPNPGEDCREKLFENYTKICKVQVYVSDDFTSPKIVKSQCQNIKKDKNDSNRTNYSRFRRGLKGGQTEIDKNSDKIRELLHESVNHLNLESSENNKYKPVEVVSATSQVVAGVLYRIRTKIGKSDCPNNSEKDLDECNLLEDAPHKVCDLKIWEKPWLKFRQTTISCEGDDKVYKFESHPSFRRKRQVPGGQFQVSKDDEFVLKYLESSLQHLDSESEHQNKLKVHEIVSVTNQIVAGHIYRIKAKIVLSDCKKSDTISRGECGTLEGAKPRTCDFKIFEQLWVPKSRETNITCEDDAQAHHFREKRSVDDFQGPRLLSGDDSTTHYNMFNDFMKKFKKSYGSKKEYKYRLKVFSDNMMKIRLLNAYEQGTATYGVTQFADMTQKEFSKSRGLRGDLRSENEAPFAHAQIPDLELPTEFDWRAKGVVTEVKNQEQCGSCWAFSVTGNVEGQYAIKYGKLLEFSEQELVDCDKDDQGCNGGLMDNAYRAIEKMGGLETEQDYPYDAEDEKCHFNRSMARVQLSGALNISHNETDMAKWLVANGPISIAINANAMQFYMGGVSHPFKFLCNPNNLDHGVLIVGYGVHYYPLFKKKLPYWIVKNSWGTSWGEQGYYRVYRGDGTCGLNQTPSSAIVA